MIDNVTVVVISWVCLSGLLTFLALKAFGWVYRAAAISIFTAGLLFVPMIMVGLQSYPRDVTLHNLFFKDTVYTVYAHMVTSDRVYIWATDPDTNIPMSFVINDITNKQRAQISETFRTAAATESAVGFKTKNFLFDLLKKVTETNDLIHLEQTDPYEFDIMENSSSYGDVTGGKSSAAPPAPMVIPPTEPDLPE